jgi:hypothetical protein
MNHYSPLITINHQQSPLVTIQKPEKVRFELQRLQAWHSKLMVFAPKQETATTATAGEKGLVLKRAGSLW